MSSRMDKYNNQSNSAYDYDYEYNRGDGYSSRSRKNEELYQEMNYDELENVNLASNAHVIGDNEKNIDVEKVKKLLEKKYNEEPRKSRALIKQEEEEYYEEKGEEETKEYNINAIIEKAKQDKDIDYERDRLKKIRDTQYDILKGLDLNDEDDEEDKEYASKVTSNKDDLVNLINTITEKELTREMNPLDILTDLKGSDNTVVLDGVKEEIENNDNIKDTIKDTVKEEVKKEFDKTFYTNSISFSKSDFDDFIDLKEGVEANKILIRILLIIVTIAFIAGVLFFANQFFDLNWF